MVVLVGEQGEESGAYLASGLDWRTSTLRQASVGDDRYMSFTRPPVSIAEGATVWIAGPQYVRMLRSVSELAGDAFKVGAWQTLAGGFRWSAGSRRNFAELFESIAAKTALVLHRSLFDPLEKSVGLARTLFEILEASATVPSVEHALNRALYFYETRDRDGFEWVREESVLVDKVFSDADSFDREFADRRGWLLEARWSEGARVPWAAPRTRDAFQASVHDGHLRTWMRLARQLDHSAREEVLR